MRRAFLFALTACYPGAAAPQLITDHGASTSSTDNAAAFLSAFQAADGDTVTVPAGTFRVDCESFGGTSFWNMDADGGASLHLVGTVEVYCSAPPDDNRYFFFANTPATLTLSGTGTFDGPGDYPPYAIGVVAFNGGIELGGHIQINEGARIDRWPFFNRGSPYTVTVEKDAFIATHYRPFEMGSADPGIFNGIVVGEGVTMKSLLDTDPIISLNANTDCEINGTPGNPVRLVGPAHTAIWAGYGSDSARVATTRYAHNVVATGGFRDGMHIQHADFEIKHATFEGTERLARILNGADVRIENVIADVAGETDAILIDDEKTVEIVGVEVSGNLYGVRVYRADVFISDSVIRTNPAAGNDVAVYIPDTEWPPSVTPNSSSVSIANTRLEAGYRSVWSRSTGRMALQGVEATSHIRADATTSLSDLRGVEGTSLTLLSAEVSGGDVSGSVTLGAGDNSGWNGASAPPDPNRLTVPLDSGVTFRVEITPRMRIEAAP